MSYNEKTSYLSLPLPHPRNTLREDCPRLRESLQQLDAHARTTDEALAARLEQATAADEAIATLQTRATSSEKEQADQGKDLERHADRLAALERRSLSATCETAGDVAAKSVILEGYSHYAGASLILSLAETNTAEAPTLSINGGDALPILWGGDAPEPGTLSAATPWLLTCDGAAWQVTATPRHDRNREEEAAAYTSAGTADETRYLLADGTDLADIFARLDSIQLTSAGAGSFVSDVALDIEGKEIVLKKTKATPGFCSYCAHCSHCGYCTYCKYCSYCTSSQCTCHC